jgi:hypothetical protein
LGFGEDGNLEEMVLPGLDANNSTILCSDVRHGQVVQVTSDAVRLLRASTMEFVTEWRPLDHQGGANEGRGPITVAAANRSQVCLLFCFVFLFFYLFDLFELSNVFRVRIISTDCG